MDEDETWHAGRPRSWPHCVRWGPASLSPKGYSPQFAAHICCGQMAGWIKMPLGMEVGLGLGDFVLDGDPSSSPKRGRSLQIFGPCLLWPNGQAPSAKGGGAPSPIFGPFLLWPNGWMHQDATRYGGRRRPRWLCVWWGPSLPQKNCTPTPTQFLTHIYCGQTAGWIKITLSTRVNLGPGDVVLASTHSWGIAKWHFWAALCGT